MRLATAEINLSALDHNLNQVRYFAPNAKVMAVLKANAYGHGLVQVAQRLQSADAFAVARIDEALALRQGGVTKPIVLLEGFFEQSDLPILLANNFETVIHEPSQLAAITSSPLTGQLSVWLKVDTGMHRLGLSPEQFSSAYHALKASPNVASNIKLMTHFACADDVQNDKTTRQHDIFKTLIDELSGQRCLANSAAILGWPHTHGDWVRPGLMLYGVSPMIDKNAADHGLAPVMRLKTRVIAIRDIKAGDSVGYGDAWTSPVDTTIAVIAMGYGDGYPRNVANGTPVHLNGKNVPIVGRVSMDMITVDLGPNQTLAKVGDEAIMWGPELPVEVIAKHAGTIAYELLCNITPRVDYQYIEKAL